MSMGVTAKAKAKAKAMLVRRIHLPRAFSSSLRSSPMKN